MTDYFLIKSKQFGNIIGYAVAQDIHSLLDGEYRLDSLVLFKVDEDLEYVLAEVFLEYYELEAVKEKPQLEAEYEFILLEGRLVSLSSFKDAFAKAIAELEV